MKSEDHKGKTIGGWVESVEKRVDKESIFSALEKAVEYGWVPEHVDLFTYMKNVERMATLLSEHHQSKLQALKEEVEGSSEIISSYYETPSVKVHQRMIPVSEVENLITNLGE